MSHSNECSKSCNTAINRITYTIILITVLKSLENDRGNGLSNKRDNRHSIPKGVAHGHSSDVIRYQQLSHTQVEPDRLIEIARAVGSYGLPETQLLSAQFHVDIAVNRGEELGSTAAILIAEAMGYAQKAATTDQLGFTRTKARRLQQLGSLWIARSEGKLPSVAAGRKMYEKRIEKIPEILHDYKNVRQDGTSDVKRHMRRFLAEEAGLLLMHRQSLLRGDPDWRIAEATYSERYVPREGGEKIAGWDSTLWTADGGDVLARLRLEHEVSEKLAFSSNVSVVDVSKLFATPREERIPGPHILNELAQDSGTTSEYLDNRFATLLTMLPSDTI